MRHVWGSSNVLGMKFTIPYDYIEDRSHIVWTQTLAEVVKVERSSSGFKTNTGTTRPCFECRDQVPISGSGVEPFPIATWLLHGEVFGSRAKIQLPLCRDHFKELRDEERRLEEKRQEWGYGGTYQVTTPEWEGPWLDTNEMWGIYNDADWEPVEESE